jgi:hypothetical protein
MGKLVLHGYCSGQGRTAPFRDSRAEEAQPVRGLARAFTFAFAFAFKGLRLRCKMPGGTAAVQQNNPFNDVKRHG